MPLREQMKTDLSAAMKARELEAVAALRSVLAAIDNAEAVPADQSTGLVKPVLGQRNEVPRKALSVDDIRQIVQHEADERRAASAKYADLGLDAEAERLARAAELIASYLGKQR